MIHFKMELDQNLQVSVKTLRFFRRFPDRDISTNIFEIIAPIAWFPISKTRTECSENVAYIWIARSSQDWESFTIFSFSKLQPPQVRTLSLKFSEVQWLEVMAPSENASFDLPQNAFCNSLQQFGGETVHQKWIAIPQKSVITPMRTNELTTGQISSMKSDLPDR